VIYGLSNSGNSGDLDLLGGQTLNAGLLKFFSYRFAAVVKNSTDVAHRMVPVR